jgi:hypothetical protein
MRSTRTAALDLIAADLAGVSPWRFQGKMSRLEVCACGLSKRERDVACRPLRRHANRIAVELRKEST